MRRTIWYRRPGVSHASRPSADLVIPPGAPLNDLFQACADWLTDERMAEQGTEITVVCEAEEGDARTESALYTRRLVHRWEPVS